MQKCLRCAEHDGAALGQACNPRDTSNVYNSDFSWNVVTQSLNTDCTAQNPGDTCGEHLCTCELGLVADVLNLLWSGVTYDPVGLHSNGFDQEAQCPHDPEQGTHPEVECCGFYDAAPFRAPFNLVNKQCCAEDQNTYNPATQECCTGSGVT